MGSAPAEIDMIDHVVTQEDLDNNPQLAAEGVKLGETIQVPAPEVKVEKGSVAFRLRDGKVRVFSKEVHGEDFEDLAKQFGDKHTSAKRL